MTTLHFSKLHATGNDFLVLVDLEARLGSRGRNRLAPSLRAALCDRRITWIGCDGNSLATLPAVLATWNRPFALGDL